MGIGKRLNLGFLVVCSLILIVGLLGLILSMQVRGLRNVELPMEQNLREVEVSIWEAIHAADAFRLTGTPYYEELYHKQLADLDEFFPRYEALIDTEEEKTYIREFNALWNEAKSAGDKMIVLTKEQEEQEKLFFEAVDGADEVIDSDIQPKWSPDDPHRLAKEQAVRELEVSIWEAIHAAHQYVGLSGEVRKHKDLYAGGTKETDFAKLMTKQFSDVDEFLSKYKALATTRWERAAIARFEGFWKQAVRAGNGMLRLHGEADVQFKTLYENVDKVDDVIDYKMQTYIQKRIEREDLTAGRIKNITIAVVLFSLCFAVLVSMRISRSIARPIEKLKEAADEIGKGKLDTILEVESRDELGMLARAFNSMVAQRKAAEDEAVSAKEFFESIITHVQESFYVCDGALNVTFLSANCKELYGYSPDDFYKDPELWIKVVHPDDMGIINAMLKKHMAGENYFEEYRIFSSDGIQKWVLDRGASILDSEGKLKVLYGTVVDITERRQAEEERISLQENIERSNKELQDFAYIVSHDLKAPLRAIGTITSWLAEDYKDKLDDAGREQLDLLLNRTQRMHGMIEGILHYSRAGKVMGEPVQVETQKIVKDVISALSPSAGIRITIHDSLPTVLIDPLKISQVFQNLISNAIKYMDKADGLIDVGCRDAGDLWEFYVKDNGPGIEEKHFERIFQIFQTLNARDDFESTGIGLTIVKKIIEPSGGRVWLESEVGKGSTFKFTLPKSGGGGEVA